MHARLITLMLVHISLLGADAGTPNEPSAQELIARHEKEKKPVWADGNKLTFFFRGDGEQVTLIIGGESKRLRHLPDSDVWTLTLERKNVDEAVFSYSLRPGKKDEPAFNPGAELRFETWRGPKAPPAPAVTKE